MRVPPKFALLIVCTAYPIIYYAWVKQIKNSWVNLQQIRSKMTSSTAILTSYTHSRSATVNNPPPSTFRNNSNRLQFQPLSLVLQLSDLSIYKLNSIYYRRLSNPSKQMMNHQLELANNIKKDGSVLLICSGSGKIIFVVGNPEIFEVKHSKLLQKNLFSIGFTLRSLLEVRRKFPNGILNFPLDPKIRVKLEYIRRDNMEESITDTDWRHMKESFVKCLQLKCSTLKAYFSDEQIRHRHCQVQKIDAIMPLQDESEEDLVLIEVQEMSRVEVKSAKDDYLYTRVHIQQSESNDMLVEEEQ